MPDMQSMQAMQQMHPMNGDDAVGHLYLQTNELHNAVVQYRRGANGAIEEVARVSTGRHAASPLAACRPKRP